MKNKNVIIGIFMFLIVLLSLNFISLKGVRNNSSNNPPPSVQPTEFLIGALNVGWVHNFNYYRDSLHFNTWHNYIAGYYDTVIGGKHFPIPNGWRYIDDNCGADYFQNPVNVYSGAVSNVIRNIYANGLGCRSLLSRPKMECLIRGQSSIYQCEDSSLIPYDKFYSFNTTETGRDVQDASNGNIWVKICEPGVDPANAYVVKNIKVKGEQAGYNGAWDFFNDNFRFWYIKPRIRIPNGTPDNTQICKIEVISYQNYLVFEKILLAENFRHNSILDTNYLEEFYHNGSLTPFFVDGDTLKPNSGDNHFDIQVKWLGYCTMWLDYVKVENDIANDLFKENFELPNNNWIQGESDQIGNTSGAYRFWVDEPEYNMLPCVKYVQNRLVNSYNANSSLLMTEYSCYHGPYGINPNTYDQLSYSDYKRKQDSMHVTEIMTANYPLHGHTKVPNTLQTSGYDSSQGFLGVPASMNVYENELQSIFDDWFIGNENGLIKGFSYPVKYLKETSPEKPFYFIPQVLMEYYYHGFENREPSTEEQEAMVDIAVSFGAKGILYYEFCSWNAFDTGSSGNSSYARAIMERDNSSPRRLNIYGEDKWNKFCELNSKLKKWGPTLMSLPIANTNSYSYRKSAERTNLATQSYILNAVTFIRDGATPICGYPDYVPSHPDLTPDCQDSTYLQIATFQNQNETYKHYFMVVNRRCSPVNENDTVGGKRYVCVTFKPDSVSFPGVNLWSVINLENGIEVGQFDRRYYRTVNLSNDNDTNNGWFKPGEGRLYHIVPKMVVGGTLAGDEYVNTIVNCKKNIYNNGYNVTLGTGANLSFEDSAGIYMNGGVLKIGNESQTYGTNLQIKGSSNNKKWQGLILEDCDTVLICGATFSNVLPNQPAVNLTNCFHFKIMNNLFNCASGENSGGIYADFSETPDGDGDSIYQYIGYNTFSFNGSTNNAVQVVSTASPEIPLFIEGNQFNTEAGSSSSSGIFLSNITGGAIKQNQITNYLTSITLVSSSCDFFGNTISSNSEDAKGIYLVLGDFGGAPSSNGNFVGGYNEITNLNSNSVNIQVENSYFDIDEGYNTFDIDFSNSQRHISGYFPSSANQFYKATYNCFKNNSVQDTASIYVTQGSSGDRITFDTDPYYCGSLEFSGFEILSLAGGINDTIFYKTGGTGGGQKEGQAMALETISGYLLLKDSIELNLRKRNYVQTEGQCKRMLLTYPDSVISVSAISKLYLSSLSLDSSGSHIQATKSFFETLIQNNPNNISLIKRANYFVQKCKVSLKQYSSALQGFQEIINQNPYSYEGLIASWDYAATTLLMGSGGEFNEGTKMKTNQNEKETMDFDFLQIMLDSLRNKKTVINSYTNENYDQKKFSKQDREIIKTNVENAFTNERTKQIEKLKDLEKKITTLSNSTSKTDKKKNEIILSEARKELNTLKVLGEVVKTKKPKNIVEHKNIVNADIKKVFIIYKVTSNKETNSQIPTQYNLSQNYPNPFNPVTKINYELPKDGRVKLVIYDILGREIKTLVNEIKQAGRYTIEFNGNNYASGVYFYRIQVEGGKSFTAVKKMVLIK